MQQKEVVYSLNNIDILSNEISVILKKTNILFLKGNLGSGKTTLVKHIVGHLGGRYCDVISPTFNLIHQYDTRDQEIWHLDLYKIRYNELANLDIMNAAQDKIIIIEWCKNLNYRFNIKYFQCFIKFTSNISVRKVQLRYF